MLNLLPLILLISIFVAEDTDCDYYLSQSDFQDGTVRIRKSGGYCLTEDIVFNPLSECPLGPNSEGCYFPTNEAMFPGSTSFKDGAYALGFFAAIAIETNDVTLDLNGYRIDWGFELYLQQRFGSVIEIANSPFLPGVGLGTNFGSNFIRTDSVVIRNGTIGLTPHHGIHSNGASNVVIRDIHFLDFEVAAIQLNGFTEASMHNLNIGPSLTEVPLTGLYMPYTVASVLMFIEPGNSLCSPQAITRMVDSCYCLYAN